MISKLQHLLLGIVVLALVRVFAVAGPGDSPDYSQCTTLKNNSQKTIYGISIISDGEDEDDSLRKKGKCINNELNIAFVYHLLSFSQHSYGCPQLFSEEISIPVSGSMLCCWRL